MKGDRNKTAQEVEGPFIGDDKEQESFISLREVVWPPLRVVEDGKNDRKYAHCLFLVFMLCFLAASFWTVYKAISDNKWLSYYKKKSFEFPVVTICGDGNVDRNHTIFDFECNFNSASDDDDVMNKCESKKVQTLNTMFYDRAHWIKGPCVVYNAIRSQLTSVDGFIEMLIFFNATISRGTALENCDWRCRTPKRYTMLISENDPSVDWDWEESFWQSYYLSTSGLTSFMIDMAKYQYKNGWRGDFYTVNNMISQPWNNDDGNSTILEIEIVTSERGVLYMEEIKPSVTVIIGSLAGFFSLMMSFFYVCFARDMKRPNILIRRVRDTKSLKKTLKEENNVFLEPVEENVFEE